MTLYYNFLPGVSIEAVRAVSDALLNFERVPILTLCQSYYRDQDLVNRARLVIGVADDLAPQDYFELGTYIAILESLYAASRS